MPRTPSRSPHRGVRFGGAVLVGALVALVLWAPGLGDYSSYVLAVVLVQVIAVLSLNLLMGYAGQVSLGHAALVGIGAYAVHQFQSYGWTFPLDLIGAVATTVVLAIIIGLPSLRIRGLQLAALTLAFGLAAERFIFARPWDEVSTAGVVVRRPDVLPGDKGFLVLAITVLCGVLLLDMSIRHSRIGRAFLAVRDREDTAATWGISVGATKLMAYALSGLYAGIAGGLYAFLVERMTPAPFDVWRSLGYVAAVVIGGAGSVAGVAIAGGLLFGLPELFRSWSQYTPLAGAVLLMVLPVIRPDGLAWLLDRRIPWPRRVPVSEPDNSSSAGTPATSDEVGSVLRSPPRPLSLTVPVRTLLSAEGIGVRFGGQEALRSVSLEVRRGELVGLIGPNGAGKTTFFNVVSGFVTPGTGTMRYRGRDLLALPPSARAGLGIGRTFQHAGLCPSSTVWENVLIAQGPLADYGVVAGLVRAPRAMAIERTLRTRAALALEAVGVEDLASEVVDSLPYGKQRLVEVAAAVAASPELLLLDEPAAGLGPDETAQLGEILVGLAESLDLTLLIIEHHIPLVAGLCSYIYVLANGTVLAHGSPDTVQCDPAVIESYLGEAAPADAEEVPSRV